MQFRKPRGLLVRGTLILWLPLAALLAILALAIFERHYDRVARQLTAETARELALVVGEIESAPDAEAARALLPGYERVYDMRFSLGSAPDGREMPSPRFWNVSGRYAASYLRQMLEPLVGVEFPGGQAARIRLQTRHGILDVRLARSRLSAVNPYLALTWTGGAGLLLALVASLFLRNQIRPVRSLAAAMRAFGEGRHLTPRSGGAVEVREARAAFLQMRGRIERHVEQRTLLLLALSHDLRTPLTRMRMELAMGADAEELDLSLQDMDDVVADFLEFARDEWQQGGVPVDVRALAHQVVQAHADAAVKLHFDLADGAELAALRAGALRRGLSNLVENAVRHGEHVLVEVARSKRWLTFAVDDDGPGIPAKERTAALARFRQVGNPEAAGSLGLGLAIAREVARLHGGELHLAKSSKLGGLRAAIRIPVFESDAT